MSDQINFTTLQGPGWKRATKTCEVLEFLLGVFPPFADVVCFHRQQAAEKYLKGSLVHHGIEPPFAHDLTTLRILCQRHDRSLNVFSKQAKTLSPFAVRFRYPGVEEPADLQTARRALRAAEIICARIR